ncbi:unnamed protein product, partial [Polarella glacialis]
VADRPRGVETGSSSGAVAVKAKHATGKLGVYQEDHSNHQQRFASPQRKERQPTEPAVEAARAEEVLNTHGDLEPDFSEEDDEKSDSSNGSIDPDALLPKLSEDSLDVKTKDSLDVKPKVEEQRPKAVAQPAPSFPAETAAVGASSLQREPAAPLVRGAPAAGLWNRAQRAYLEDLELLEAGRNRDRSPFVRFYQNEGVELSESDQDATPMGTVTLTGSVSLRSRSSRRTPLGAERDPGAVVAASPQRKEAVVEKAKDPEGKDDATPVAVVAEPASSAPAGGWAVDLIHGRWFRVVACALSIRRRPQVDAPLGGELLRGEVFEASSGLVAEDGFAFLELASGRGWVFNDSRVQPVRVLNCPGGGAEASQTPDGTSRTLAFDTGDAGVAPPKNLGLAMRKAGLLSCNSATSPPLSARAEAEPEPRCGQASSSSRAASASSSGKAAAASPRGPAQRSRERSASPRPTGNAVLSQQRGQHNPRQNPWQRRQRQDQAKPYKEDGYHENNNNNNNNSNNSNNNNDNNNKPLQRRHEYQAVNQPHLPPEDQALHRQQQQLQQRQRTPLPDQQQRDMPQQQQNQRQLTPQNNKQTHFQQQLQLQQQQDLQLHQHVQQQPHLQLQQQQQQLQQHQSNNYNNNTKSEQQLPPSGSRETGFKARGVGLSTAQQPVRAKHGLSQVQPPVEHRGGGSGFVSQSEPPRAHSAEPTFRGAWDALQEQQRLQAALLKVALRSACRGDESWRGLVKQRDFFSSLAASSAGRGRLGLQPPSAWPSFADAGQPRSRELSPASASAPGTTLAQGCPTLELSGQFLATMRGQVGQLTPRRAAAQDDVGPVPPEGSAKRRSASAGCAEHRTWRFEDILLTDRHGGS